MGGSIKNVRTGLLAQVRGYVDSKIDARLSHMETEARMQGQKKIERGFSSWRLNELKAAARRVGSREVEE